MFFFFSLSPTLGICPKMNLMHIKALVIFQAYISMHLLLELKSLLPKNENVCRTDSRGEEVILKRIVTFSSTVFSL